MTSWRSVAAVMLALFVGGLAIGEGVARTALDRRLSDADTGAMSLEFVGTSALLSIVTREVPLQATVEVSELAGTLAEQTDAPFTSIETADGMIGLTFEQGLGILPGPATAWVSLEAVDGEAVATVVSVAVGDLQIEPRRALGSGLTFPIAIPQGQCDTAPHIEAVDVTDDAVQITFTASASTLSCLENQEES